MRRFIQKPGHRRQPPAPVEAATRPGID